MGLFCGQKLPPGTQKVAPGTELPRWAPSAWTKATFWHQTSTKSTSCVDKSHLLAPNFHKKHLLCGQAATFFLRVHKNAPACGQKSPPGTQKVAPSTVLPRWAPSVWTGGNIFPPRPQKCPRLWTKVTYGHPEGCSWHLASTLGTSCVDRRQHFSSASTKDTLSVDRRQYLSGSGFGA